MPETAKRTARVPILGEDGRISDDYVPAAIGEGVESAEAAAKRAETAATNAEGSATAASKSAAGAQGSASAAEESADQARESATAASGAVTQAQSAQQAAEAAKTGAESAKDSAQTAASQAQQSATAAAESAASVANKFITSAQATTLEPGSQATASVESQVLTIGVPKGEKGDKGDQGDKGDPGTGVPDGGTPGQLLSKTETGTAWVDPPSGNVLTGEVEGYVAHADDAYAQKPREVRLKGKTWVNRWPQFSTTTTNGITLACDETGLFTVSGTATNDAFFDTQVVGVAAGKQVTLMVSTISGANIWVEQHNADGNMGMSFRIVATTTGATGMLDAAMTELHAVISVPSGTTVNASFRVMLVEGTEAPDCFTPCASITSAQLESLVTSGKNLAGWTISHPTTVNGVTLSDNGDGGIRVAGTSGTSSGFTKIDLGKQSVPKGERLTLSGCADGSADSYWLRWSDITTSSWQNQGKPISFKNVNENFGQYVFVFKDNVSIDTVIYPQLELGSTATAYEPPTVTKTPLPEVELRSLPNGTCDELVIKADGMCEVERKTVAYQVQGTESLAVGEHTTGQKYVSTNDLPFTVVTKPDDFISDKYLTGAWNANTDKYAYVPSPGTMIICDNRFTDNETAKQILASEKPWFVCVADTTEEPQSPVTLPALPAPTFNVYHDSQVPSDTSTEYARDINIAFDNLAKQIAGTASAVAVREASTIEEE